jgi:magnesium transporter
VIVDCAHYRNGRRQREEPMGLDEAAELCARSEEGFVWLGLVEPSQEELAQVQQRFGLHDLAVEDAQSFHLRPKFELYDERVYFLVLRTARYDADEEEVQFGEISLFIGPSFVISVRQGIASDLHPARLRLERRPELLAEGTGSVLWAVLDQVVDDYGPVIEGLERDIEEVESTVFTGDVAPTERIYFLRREATDFYRAVHPLLLPLDGLERGSYKGFSAQLGQYFRDVNDHLKLVNDEAVAQRDLLTTVLEANMAVISMKQNETVLAQGVVVRKISGWAAVIAVPTFIASVYGMNFEHMPELDGRFGYPLALAVMAAVAFGLYRYFKRVGWL